MPKNNSGMAPLLVILLIVAAGAIGISAIVVSNTLLQREPERSAAGSPKELPTNLPEQAQVPDRTPRPSKTPVPTPASVGGVKEESGTTATGWAYEGMRDVEVVPSVDSDKLGITIVFKRSTFSDINSIYYNLSYQTNEAGVTRGTEQTFNPQNLGQGTEGALKTITKQIVLGDCSKNVCNYHASPRSFTLTVTSTRVSGAKYSQTLTKASL